MNVPVKLWISLLVLASTVSGQDKKDEKKTKPSASINLSLQLVRTDGTRVLIEQDVPDPNSKPVPQTFTVKVPVRKTVLKDGKPVIVVEYVQQTRTRMTRPTVRRSMTVLEHQEFRDIKGNTIPMDELIGKLGMGQGRYVVQINPGMKIPPGLMKAFSKDTIFLHFKNAKK